MLFQTIPYGLGVLVVAATLSLTGCEPADEPKPQIDCSAYDAHQREYVEKLGRRCADESKASDDEPEQVDCTGLSNRARGEVWRSGRQCKDGT